MEKLTMSVQEAAEALGVSVNKMYDLARSAGFPTIRLGCRLVISKKGLERWLDEQTEKAMSSARY